ncbi:MAG: hypothetical protein ACRDZX_06195, partial [Acidimicrobiales bacterium]
MRLDSGTQLLGEVQGGAFTQPRYLVRRADGAVMQVSALIYFLLEALDGRYGQDPSSANVAEHVTRRCGRILNVDGAEYLLREKVAALGLLEDLPGGSSGDERGPGPAGRSLPGRGAPGLAARPTQMLGLRLRTKVVPERLYRIATRALAPLFWPPVVVVVLLTVAAGDAWGAVDLRPLVFHGFKDVLASPPLLLAMYVTLTLAAAFHELGHASAARYDGARSGVMGVGIYLVWPVFYTDVTDTYRLSRKARLRTDLGGVYFHSLVALVALGAYIATGSPACLAIASMLQLMALYQFLPFLRFDGYYILSDLVGVPNLFVYVKVVLRRLARRRPVAGAVDLSALTRKARTAVQAWVIASISVLLGDLALTGFLAPRLLPQLWSTTRLDAARLVRSADHADPVGVLDNLFGLLVFIAFVAGSVFMLARMGVKLAAILARSRFAARTASNVRAAFATFWRRPALSLGCALAIVSLAYGATVLSTSPPGRLNDGGVAAVPPLTAPNYPPARRSPPSRPTKAAAQPGPTQPGPNVHRTGPRRAWPGRNTHGTREGVRPAGPLPGTRRTAPSGATRRGATAPGRSSPRRGTGTKARPTPARGHARAARPAATGMPATREHAKYLAKTGSSGQAST